MVLIKNIEAINPGFIAKLRQENVKSREKKQAEEVLVFRKAAFKGVFTFCDYSIFFHLKLHIEIEKTLVYLS